MAFNAARPCVRHFPLSMLSYLPNSTDTIHDLVDAASSEIAVQHQTKYCQIAAFAAGAPINVVNPQVLKTGPGS
jgi:hypothetical protein